MSTFSLARHAALVTGSSQGIGFAIVNGLRDAGARVVFHGLPGRADHLPDDAPCISPDLTQPDAPARLLAAAVGAAPQVDTLVCNAGSFFCALSGDDA